MKKVMKAIIASVLSCCLIGSLGVNVVLLQNSQTQNDKVNTYISDQLARQAEEMKKENTYKEDGFVVGDQYEIRSTKAISDAYISGDESKLNEDDKKTLKMAKRILKKIIKKDMNNYQKEEAVYNWMFKNIGQGDSAVVMMPGTTGENFTPLGVLTGRTAVCVGYATTFRMFMNMMGMECHVVHNDYHSWDLVKLDDGAWYHTDVYSDVSSRTQYENFNMSDSFCKRGHDWDSSCLPEAKGIKYTYAMQHHKQLKNIYEVPAQLKKGIDKKKTSMFFDFKSMTEKEMKAADVLVGQANKAINYIGLDSKSISASWFDGENNTYILGIFIADYTDTPSKDTMDDKVRNKMTDKVNKAFGTTLEPEEWNE